MTNTAPDKDPTPTPASLPTPTPFPTTTPLAYTRRADVVLALQYIDDGKGATNRDIIEKFTSVPPDEGSIPANLLDNERLQFIREATRHNSTHNPSTGEFSVRGALCRPGDFVIQSDDGLFHVVEQAHFRSHFDPSPEKTEERVKEKEAKAAVHHGKGR